MGQYDMVGDYEPYPEIVGEMTRGGQGGGGWNTLELLGHDGAYQLVGEMIQQSPAMAAYAQKIARSRPMLKKLPLTRARDWDIPLPAVSGSASTTTTITVQPQCLFRCEKVMATDTAPTAGLGTSITQVLIGQRLQRPATGNGTVSLFFSQQALGNGVRWDTCKEALSISLTVSFISQCTFYCTLFGKAVI